MRKETPLMKQSDFTKRNERPRRGVPAKTLKKKKKKKSGLGSVLYRFHKFSNVAPSFRGTWSRLDEAGAKQEAHNQFRAREEEEEEQRSLPRLYSRPKNSFTAEEDRDRWMRGSWPVSIEGCNTRRVYVHTIHAHTDTYIYIYIYVKARIYAGRRRRRRAAAAFSIFPPAVGARCLTDRAVDLRVRPLD